MYDFILFSYASHVRMFLTCYAVLSPFSSRPVGQPIPPGSFLAELPHLNPGTPRLSSQLRSQKAMFDERSNFSALLTFPPWVSLRSAGAGPGGPTNLSVPPYPPVGLHHNLGF